MEIPYRYENESDAVIIERNFNCFFVQTVCRSEQLYCKPIADY